MNYSKWLEKGIPDFILRLVIRYLLRKKVRNEPFSPEIRQNRLNQFIKKLNSQSIAIRTQDANQQHYEVPTDFFQTVLGKKMKYSACLWPTSDFQKKALYFQDLDKAETDMLALTCERAQILDGMSILDLGCGWGSLSIYLAEKFPNASILAISNSKTQKEYIETQVEKKELKNLKVKQADVQIVELEQKYDRIISIEMFEHMRNYPLLFRKLARSLRESGKLFIHIFTYRHLPYLFKTEDPNDWMARNFFSGGTMPSIDLLVQCARDVYLEQMWNINGTHYAKTLKAWLQKMDQNQKRLIDKFRQIYGEKDYKKWWHYWRTFFIICEELFKFQHGNQWMVSHYLFSK